MLQRQWTLYEDSTTWITVGVMCYPHHWGMHWRENGARKPEHALDTTLMIGPWSFNLTWWHIGRLSRVIHWIPAGRDRRGHHVGW